MGAGIEMAEGDIAFKCNFATYDPATSVIVKRRADRRFEEEGPILCSVLDGEHWSQERHSKKNCSAISKEASRTILWPELDNVVVALS